MSRASWSKLGGGKLRNWSSPASLAGTGAGPRGSGPRRRGAACCWTAPGQGGAAACGAARSAAAGAQREVLRLSGVVHVVGGAGRACSPAASPCRAPGRRLRRPQCPRAAPPLPPRHSRCAGQRSSNLARGGRQGCCSFCQASQVAKGSAHALGGNGHLSLLRCHGRRLLNGLRRAALHLLCALPRLVQEALHVTGPAYDLRRRLRRARTGTHLGGRRPGRAESGRPARLRAPRPLRL